MLCSVGTCGEVAHEKAARCLGSLHDLRRAIGADLYGAVRAKLAIDGMRSALESHPIDRRIARSALPLIGRYMKRGLRAQVAFAAAYLTGEHMAAELGREGVHQVQGMQRVRRAVPAPSAQIGANELLIR